MEEKKNIIFYKNKKKEYCINLTLSISLFCNHLFYSQLVIEIIQFILFIKQQIPK